MPKDKTETYQKIIPAAKEEFLEKGYEQASMRSIASRIGISAAGIYRHFSDKEDLFAALVEPVLNTCNKWFEGHKEKDYELLEKNDLDAMWSSGADLQMMMELVYEHYDEFKLIICCSEGTRYSNFIHELVSLEQRETEMFLQAAKQRGIQVKEIKPQELHLLLTAYVGALFEVVIHDFSKDDAAHYLETLQAFFYPGWRAVLGL